MAFDPVEKSFDFAQETVKQLIALSTGVVALTVTFSEDVLGDKAAEVADTLTRSWIAFLVSIVFGVWSLMALTGSLGAKDSPEIYGWGVRLPAILQILAFAIGMVLTIKVGASAL